MSTPGENIRYAKNENKYYPDKIITKRSVEMANDVMSTDLNTRFKNLIREAENNKQILYPYAMLVLTSMPVIILICKNTVGAYMKSFVIMIYTMMIILTLFLLRK